MSIEIKQKIKEVADDFGMPAPKNPLTKPARAPVRSTFHRANFASRIINLP